MKCSRVNRPDSQRWLAMYEQGLLALHIDVCYVCVPQGVQLARRLSRRCGCSRREHILHVYQCSCCVCGTGWRSRLSLVASKWMALLYVMKTIPLRSNSTRPIRLERKVFIHQKAYKALTIYYYCCVADYFERIHIYENSYPTGTV